MFKIIKNIFAISNLSNKIIITYIASTLLLTILEICSIGIIFPFLELITNPNYNHKLLEYFLIRDEKSKLILILFLILIIFIIKNIYIFIFNYYQKKLSLNKQKYLAQKVFKSYLFSDFSKKIQTSEILRDINYANSISQWIISALQFISELTILIFLIFFLFFINFKATFLILLVCSIFYIIFHMIFRTKIKKWSKENVIYSNNNYNSQLETFSGLREITIAGKQSFFENKYLNSLKELILRSFKISILDILPKILLELVFVTTFIILTFYFYYSLKSIQSIIPMLGLYFLSSLRILPAFNKIIMLTNSLNYANSPINILKNIYFFNQETEEKEKFVNNINEIELKKVSFKYNEHYILKDCNFKFKKNIFYILAGPSGIGKTTVLNIIMGLLNPIEGEILVDKINLKYCLKNFRQKIGLVSQDVFITNSSVAENIALGIEKSDIDLLKVWKCLNLAELDKFIEEKKEKLNFIIESNGKNISAGQRQRIGIARALYNDPFVLILDEPTSSLDEKIANEFILSLKKISENRIIIMITHNINRINHLDQIIILKDKKLLLKE